MNVQNESLPLQIVGAAANPIIGRVWELALPLCLDAAIELVHVEYQREQSGRTLRIYLDKPGGVTLDDCADISRQLSDLLDVALETRTTYRLEVSSPGIRRPLGKLDDFVRFKGGRVKIRTAQAVDGQKNFTGILNGVIGTEDLHMIQLMNEVNQTIVAIAFDSITKAQLLDGENACL